MLFSCRLSFLPPLDSRFIPLHSSCYLPTISAAPSFASSHPPAPPAPHSLSPFPTTSPSLSTLSTQSLHRIFIKRGPTPHSITSRASAAPGKHARFVPSCCRAAPLTSPGGGRSLVSNVGYRRPLPPRFLLRGKKDTRRYEQASASLFPPPLPLFFLLVLQTAISTASRPPLPLLHLATSTPGLTQASVCVRLVRASRASPLSPPPSTGRCFRTPFFACSSPCQQG